MDETQLPEQSELSERDAAIEAFWEEARGAARRGDVPVVTGSTSLDMVQPPAWSFGATPQEADDLLALVLSGRKTATAGAVWDYEAEGEELPSPGDLAIILDGQERPRALIATTSVTVVPFDEVSAEVAAAEGEGDLSLEHWRRVHERFFTEHADHDRGFARDMPVVIEEFRLLHPPPHPVTS